MNKNKYPDWNKIRVKDMGYSHFKKVYEDYVERKVLNGKYKKLNEQQTKLLFDNIIGSKGEIKEDEPQVIN